jgi:hypothetical protein
MSKNDNPKLTSQEIDAMAEAIAGFFYEFWTKRQQSEKLKK